MLQKPDPHTQKVLDLANFLDELEPEKFSMRSWGTWNEPRCICGWFMHTQGRMDKDNWEDAGKMLGIDRQTACKMFSQTHDHITVGPKEAAKALREYAVTGEFKGW